MECTTLGKEALPALDRLPASPVWYLLFFERGGSKRAVSKPHSKRLRLWAQGHFFFFFFGIKPHGCSDLLGRGQRGSFGRAGLLLPNEALGPQLYVESSSWALMLDPPHPQIITFQVLGEQNRIFIEKNKVDPFFLSP